MNTATRTKEKQVGDDSQTAASVAQWLKKIDVNEVLTYIDTDHDASYAFDRANEMDSPDAIGLVFMAVKRNYAERLALRELELDGTHLLSDGAAALHALTGYLIGRAAKFNEVTA